jgi:hypothetical protein
MSLTLVTIFTIFPTYIQQQIQLQTTLIANNFREGNWGIYRKVVKEEAVTINVVVAVTKQWEPRR